MRTLLGNIVGLPRNGGLDADGSAKESVDDDRLVCDVYGLTAAKVSAIEKVGPS